MKYLFIISILVFISCKESKKTEETPSKPITVIEALNQAVKDNELSAEPYINRADHFVNLNKTAFAKQDLETAIKLEPENSTALLKLANILFKENNTRGTKDLLYLSIDADSSNTDAILKLAELYLYLAQYDSTFKFVNQALRQDEELAKGYFLKGMAYKYSNNNKLAKSSFQTTVELDPDYYHAFIQLGSIAASEDNPVAISYYENALSVNPNSVEAWYHMGYFLQSRLDTAGAIAAYEKMRKLEPTNTDALYNLGYIEFEIKKNTNKALAYFQEILKIRRSHSKALYMVGLCFETLGEKEKAISYYRESSSSNPAFELPKEGIKRLR